MNELFIIHAILIENNQWKEHNSALPNEQLTSPNPKAPDYFRYPQMRQK